VSAYTEQEEVEKLKHWWKNYGNSLVAGVLLGLVALGGARYWQEYRQGQLVDASILYDELLQQARTRDDAAARKSGQHLVDDYPSTPYAGMAALVLARLSFEAGDHAQAAARLRWAEQHAADDAVVHSARLKLARLLQAAGKGNEALTLIDVRDYAGFGAEYLELKGDLLLEQGHIQEARTAYAAALKGPNATSAYRELLSMKLADLGPEQGQ